MDNKIIRKEILAPANGNLPLFTVDITDADMAETVKSGDSIFVFDNSRYVELARVYNTNKEDNLTQVVIYSVICRFEIEAPDIARTIQAGQFISLMTDKDGEKIPLTMQMINDNNVIIAVQGTGASTLNLLANFNEGDLLYSFAGPHGQPSELEKMSGKILGISGGTGTAVMYPVLKKNKEIGNKIISVIGSKTQSSLIMEQDIRAVSDKLIIFTDDGSCGRKGFVTSAIKEIMESAELGKIIAIGPIPMMMEVKRIVEEINQTLPIIVSLPVIMCDCTRMCGDCVITVDNTNQYACEDGPEFDARLLNWSEIVNRQNVYKKQEKKILENFLIKSFTRRNK